MNLAIQPMHRTPCSEKQIHIGRVTLVNGGRDGTGENHQFSGGHRLSCR